MSKITKADEDLRKMLSEKRMKSDDDRRVGSEVFDKKPWKPSIN